ncbi:integrase core domain-containing protein [Amycolatopsis sp. NBC_00355]|uniref:integrase core domain-containing protein n=1 Tax=Amycolatopsis sp. NBC_00355 TaxID=2975957 RepID=UPI003FA46759
MQYLAIRYTQRLAETGGVTSGGSTGDSCDNAMAEAFDSLYKAELVHNKGPWRGLDDLEIATVEYIDWYNTQRLHSELGHVPPAEYEGAPLVARSGNEATAHAIARLYGCSGQTQEARPMKTPSGSKRSVGLVTSGKRMGMPVVTGTALRGMC